MIDVNELSEDNPYRKAIEFGIDKGREEVNFKGLLPIPHQELMVQIAYWAAWRAARNAATRMLNKAAELELTEYQMQQLRDVAEAWAYD